MFKRTRIKITAAIMASLAVIFGVTLTVIYLASYTEVSHKNQEMLARYAREYFVNGNPSQRQAEGLPENPGLPAEGPEPFLTASGDRAFRLATFYSVEFSEQETVVSVDNDGKTISDAALTEMAGKLMAAHKTRGNTGKFTYLVETQNGVTLVVFMDNTVISDLYEHQSSFNPNMPLRGLSYFARLYENYVRKNNLDI